jgi:hypothetical protein
MAITVDTLAAIAPALAAVPAANDNDTTFARPVVHAPRRRPDATYARSANVILPLRFAERMAGWRARPARR